MSETKTQTAFPFFGILGIAFIILKLTGVIAWSWWWVLAPLWGPLTVALVIAVVAATGIAIASATVRKKTKPAGLSASEFRQFQSQLFPNFN